MTRVWFDISKAEKTSMAKSRVDIPPKLERLKDFVILFFAEMDGIQRAFEHDKNYLTVEVLKIVEKMVELGFYKTEAEILKIIEPIISLLDGSNDFVSQEDEESFKLA